MSNKTNHLGILAFVMAVVLSVAGNPLLAQVSTATVTGTISDTTGAVLPGVEVTITNIDNGRTRLAISGDEGRYSTAQLAAGNYEIRAELAGFQAGVRRGFRLLVGQRAIVNFTMEIGSISQEVIVTGEAALVNTTSSTLSEVINEVQVHDLPLNSRNLTLLSLLTPGVVQLRTSIAGGVIQGASSVRVSVGGARTYQTGYLLDGSDVTDSSRGIGPGGAAGALFGVETIKEFQVITNNFSAEYGRFSGGVMSMVTKSGSNDFHGSAFWFHRNDNLDASNFFDNSFGNEQPEFRRHQFGGTIGGPIVKDKTFFFFSYEGFREGLGTTNVGLVPSVEAKQGLFPATNGACDSSLASKGGVFDPGLDRCVLQVNPASIETLTLLPDPNGLDRGITGDRISGKTQSTEEDFFTVRVDHTFGDADSFFARLTTSIGDKDLAIDGQRSFLDSALTTVENTNIYSTLEWKHIFSPNTINTVRGGAQRNRFVEDCTIGGPLKIGFFPDRCMGRVDAGNGTMHLGNWVVGQNISNQFAIGDDLFLTRGRHDLKIGFLITGHQTNDFVFASGDGRFQFSSVADLVVGTPFAWDGKIPADRPQRGVRQKVYGFYIQDDFKLRPNLTINLGLRYEPTESPGESNDLLGNLRDPFDTEPTVGEPFFKDPSNVNFAPRIGIAWDPFGDGKTSIRIGAGIFDDIILPFHYGNQIRRSPPFALQPDIRDTALLAAVWPNAPQEALTAPGGTLNFQAAEFDPSRPYVAQWNFTLQREISDITLTASYVGSKGTHVQIQRNVNTRVPEILPDGRKLFRKGLPDRNPAWADIDYWEFSSNSSYHGLQLGGRKRFSRGLQFQASYTFGRSIDLASSINQSDIQENTSKQPQDSFDVKASQRGLSDHDVRHNFSFNFVYEIPRRDLSGAAGVLLNGWQVNGILSLATGNPLRLITGSGSNLTDYDRDGESGGGGQQPSVRPGSSNSPVREDGRDPQQYYDPSAFFLQDPGFYGDVGRNTLIGPGLSTFDFSLFKNTNLAEGVTAQFRVEFFNIFNRANFGTPDRNVFSGAEIESVPCSTFGATGPDAGCDRLVSATVRPTAGRITSTKTTNRQIQLGLRFIF